MAFKKASAPQQPRHYIITKLKETENRGLSASGAYNVFGLKFAPVTSTRGRDERFYLVFRPEWLEKGFDPATLDKSAGFVYRNNIAQPKKTGPLEAILGRSLYDALAAQIDAQGSVSVDEFYDYFEQAVGNKVGLILAQESEKEGEDRFLTDNLNVGGFFTEEEVGGINERAAKDIEAAEVDDNYIRRVRLAWELDDEYPFVSEGEEVEVA